MDTKEMYDRICAPKFSDIARKQEETHRVIGEILHKLKNGITERLQTIVDRLFEQNERIDKLERLVWRLLFAVLGLFGSMIIGLVIVLIRGVTG